MVYVVAKATNGLFICCLLFSCSVQAIVWQVGEQAAIKGRYIVLSDLIAKNQTEVPEAFKEVVIATAPHFGEQSTISRAQILNAMHRALGFVYD